MITLREKIMTGVIISLLAISSGQIIITNWTHTYYCETEDSVKECWKLSSTNKSCYYDASNPNKRDLCVGGTWKLITNYIPEPKRIKQFNVTANGKNWICQITEDKVNSYTKCYSGAYEGYLGELV